MSHEIDLEVFNLLQRATLEAQKGNTSNVTDLMNEAIHITENEGGVSVTLHTFRERLLFQKTRDRSQIITALHHQLDVYKSMGHITYQIETMRQLAFELAMNGNKSDSLSYLVEAEQLINSLNKKNLVQIARELQTKKTMPIYHFIHMRISMIQKMKADINKLP